MSTRTIIIGILILICGWVIVYRRRSYQETTIDIDNLHVTKSLSIPISDSMFNIVSQVHTDLDMLTSGTEGRLVCGKEFLYICVENDKWKRVKLESVPIDEPIVPRLMSHKGRKGQMICTEHYWYICISTNVWRRISLEAWTPKHNQLPSY